MHPSEHQSGSYKSTLALRGSILLEQNPIQGETQGDRQRRGETLGEKQLHPEAVRGQIEGGILQGLGLAVMEELVPLKLLEICEIDTIDKQIKTPKDLND